MSTQAQAVELDSAVDTRRNAAAILALCSWVKKQIEAVEKRAKDIADTTFPGEAVAGVYQGHVVATTARRTRKPNQPFDITDETAFIAWVAKRWPTEIISAVRPSFLTVLAASADEHDGYILDPQGEVCPHAALAEPIEYVQTLVKKDAGEHLAPLLDVPLGQLAALIEQDDQ